MHAQHQELPIIDLLDNIHAQMEIMLKSEPISPRMDELESCLLSTDAIDEKANFDSPSHENRQDVRLCEQSPQTGRATTMTTTVTATTATASTTTTTTINDTTPHAELRWLRPRSAALQTSKRRQRGASRVAYTGRQRDHKSSANRTYCRFCQKTFSRAWSLQRHLADTHFYVPQSLSCDQCGRSYKSRNSLVSHKSQYHARRERKEHEAQCEVTY